MLPSYSVSPTRTTIPPRRVGSSWTVISTCLPVSFSISLSSRTESSPVERESRLHHDADLFEGILHQFPVTAFDIGKDADAALVDEQFQKVGGQRGEMEPRKKRVDNRFLVGLIEDRIGQKLAQILVFLQEGGKTTQLLRVIFVTPLFTGDFKKRAGVTFGDIAADQFLLTS